MTEKDKKKSNAPCCSNAFINSTWCGWILLNGNVSTLHSLGIEADRNSLYSTDVIDGTSLFKVSKCDMPVFFVHADRCDRCGNLLDQGKLFLGVLFVCTIDGDPPG